MEEFSFIRNDKWQWGPTQCPTTRSTAICLIVGSPHTHGLLLSSIAFCVIHFCSLWLRFHILHTLHSVQQMPITQYIIQFFINWFQIGVVHHKNEECSNENRMCHYLRRVLEIVDFIVLSAQIDHMLPVVNSHCVAKTTTPYINYIAGKTSFLLLHVHGHRNNEQIKGHLRFVHTGLRQRQQQLKYFSFKNGLHWTLWKCSHGDLWQRQRQPKGPNTIHSFRFRWRSQCERTFRIKQVHKGTTTSSSALHLWKSSAMTNSTLQTPELSWAKTQLHKKMSHNRDSHIPCPVNTNSINGFLILNFTSDQQHVRSDFFRTAVATMTN